MHAMFLAPCLPSYYPQLMEASIIMDFVTGIVTVQTAQRYFSLFPCTTSKLERRVLWVLRPRIPTIVKSGSMVVAEENAQVLHVVEIQSGSSATDHVVQLRSLNHKSG